MLSRPLYLELSAAVTQISRSAEETDRTWGTALCQPSVF